MSLELAVAIHEACRRVLPEQRPLPLHEPELGAEEQRLVAECLQSGWVSTAGPYVERFEAKLRELTGARHAIAVVNGTAALHAALLVAGVRPGDEVLAPALTFVATANAIAYCGAVPHFAEVSAATLGVDPEALDSYLRSHAAWADGATIDRATRRPIRALVVMHTFGHPADMTGLRALAEHWQLALVEDAAESIGSYYQGKHTGTLGDIGTLSFNGNKIVTTGGGGAILSNDDALGRHARHLCTTARMSARWNFVHDEVGYNYRMPSLNAALGLAQLEKLPQLLAAKRSLARRYAQEFAGLHGARFYLPASIDSSNHWLNALILDEANADACEAVLAHLNNEGIQARPAWTPMHRLPMYESCPRMPLALTDSLASRIINLPSSPGLASPAAR